MKKKEFYVYGLIDPCTNDFFYIGKGKGDRYLSHLKKNKWDFNFAKLESIQDIVKSGFEVEIEILFPNLDEETAFDLEKTLIYNIGRKVFSEGKLTNLNPGGKWKPGDSVFYAEDEIVKFDIKRLDEHSQEKFLNFGKISNFNYLNKLN